MGKRQWARGNGQEAAGKRQQARGNRQEATAVRPRVERKRTARSEVSSDLRTEQADARERSPRQARGKRFGKSIFRIILGN